MTEISDYDFFGYDYSNYWKKRKYEDQSEKHLLNKIFSEKKGKWFLDIGGSYGRLSSTYYKQYKHPVILDYSLKTLQKNKSALNKLFPSIELIAANAYRMPFAEDIFDGALMVRVLHHIEKPEEYFHELNRVMRNDGYYVQEFANKVNAKASIREILKGNFKYLSKEAYQQPTGKNFEGTKSGEEALFFNYHPSYVKEVLRRNNFKIIKKHGCSYLRSQKLKQMIGEDSMLKQEYILQPMLSWTNIAPSIVFETQLMEHRSPKPTEYNKLEDILVCPNCHQKLKFSSDKAKCTECKNEYSKLEGIWDFRIN